MQLIIATILFFTGLASFAGEVKIQDLAIIQEKVFSYAKQANNMDSVINGNFPNTLTAGDHPNAVTSGNFPDAITSGNFPTSGSISATFPNTVISGNFPDTVTSGTGPSTIIGTEDVVKNLSFTDANYPSMILDGNYPSMLTDVTYPDMLLDGDYPNVMTDGSFPNPGDSSGGKTELPLPQDLITR